MERIRVAVAGAKGKMGQAVVKMVLEEPAFELAAAVDSQLDGVGVREIITGIPETEARFYNQIERIEETSPDVLVDFTRPDAVIANAWTAISLGIRPVIGTTGLKANEIEMLKQACEEKGIGGIVAPNFAIGAVLMMRFAAQAARYLPYVEIIEYHHDEKLDAPSGTALKTAEMIAEVRKEFKQGSTGEREVLDGVRGGYYHGFRLHSVRMPGYVAHQEVLLGTEGQQLTIRHDSIDRSSFMPGVKLAIKAVMEQRGLIEGLDPLLA